MSNGPTLFQDETEEDGPSLFQIEPDEETESFLFQDELAERQVPKPQTSCSGLDLLKEEPDELCDQYQPQLFGAELDKEISEDSESGNSAYVRDTESSSRCKITTVQLNFATMDKFLSSHLKAATETKTAEPNKKKRRYNNANRAKAAADRKQSKPAGEKRPARNDTVSDLILKLFGFVCLSWVWMLTFDL